MLGCTLRPRRWKLWRVLFPGLNSGKVFVFLDRRGLLDDGISGDKIHKGLRQSVGVIRPDNLGMIDHMRILSRVAEENVCSGPF